MKRKITKILLSIIIFIIAISIKVENIWIKPILFIVSYLIVGFEVIKEAIENITKGNWFDEHFLMSIATIGALAIKEFPEAVAVMIFYNIGEIFEELGENKSKKSIADLMDIKQDFANVKLEDGKIEKKKPEEVSVGDEIIVKPGEKIPLDGVVISGNSMIDMKALTGESIPNNVKKGDTVISGSINLDGILTIKVTKVYSESTVSKILELVKNASDRKAKAENFITKFSKIYTPTVITLALAIIIFGALSKTCEMTSWIYRALTFLVISCPCALVISVPLSFFVGIGGASKKGILIKGSSYMDILANLDTIIFDKTGTLTKGVFEVQEVVTHDISKEQLIEYTALAEHFSNHPIANSIKKLYTGKVKINRISDLQEIAGKGIKCKVDGKNILVGSKKLLEEQKIEILENEKYTEGTILFVAIDEKYVGKIIISDTIKEESLDLIQNLKKLGVKKTIMLTGDKKEEAEKVSQKLGINEVYSNLLPNQKIEKLEEILEFNKINKLGNIAYVGDGINDSPSLARADVGIAMGALGSDSAIEASDVVIMTDEINKIAETIKISKKTINRAKQNITFAIFVKILILFLSLLGLTNMWMAVFADVGVTLIAILNSLRKI